MHICCPCNNFTSLHFQLIHIYIQEEIDLPRTLTVPIKNHKTAHNAPKIEMKKNPLFLLLLLALAEPFTAVFIACILNLLKLDIRSNARFTNGLSAAEAGAVGIESTNDHKEDENQLPPPLPSFLLPWSCLGPLFTKPEVGEAFPRFDPDGMKASPL